MIFRIPGIKIREGYISSENVTKNISRAIAVLNDKNLPVSAKIIVPTNLGIDAIYWIFAAVLTERVVVPISGDCTKPELNYIKRALGESHLVLDPVPAEGSTGEINFSSAFFSSDNPCAVIFTSGSSGKPKGIVLSRKNFLVSAKLHAKLHGENTSDRWLCNLPLNHVGGFSIPWRALFLGQDFAYEKQFNPETILWWIRSNDITHISMVPTMLHRILNMGDIKAGKAFKAILLGGAPATEALLDRAENADLLILTTYGLTESCSQIITSPYSFPRRISDGVGLVNAGQIRISAEGEIQIHKNFIAKTLLTEDGEQKTLTTEEYFSSGDLGRIDENGHLHVLGRKDELIISGGVNIFPQEVEAALQKHKAIENCCVVGVPDEEWGQKLVAAIQLKADISTVSFSDLRDFLAQNLNSKKIPKEFLRVIEIPSTKSGKNIRHKVVEIFKKHSLS